ncbi:MAG: histidine kinase [Hyphomicrobium sp.]
MSIQLRLNILIGLLSVLGLVGMIAAMMLDAQPRTRAESQSVMQLTDAIVRGSLAPLSQAADPKRTLMELVDRLQTLRHVTVSLASSTPLSPETTTTAGGSSYGLPVHDNSVPPSSAIPVQVNGQVLDTIIITAQPADEIAELWDAARRIFEYGAVVCLALFALTGVVINRALQPIEMLGGALNQLEAGDYAVAIPVTGPPEIRGICSGVNRLATKLNSSRQENRRLTTHMIHVQDSERREIARELHDELGPYLFSMRTAGSVLERELKKPAPDLSKALRLGHEMSAQLDSLQQTNRRVLQRLTPAGLQELGLKGALIAIVAMWQREKPDVELQLDIGDAIDNLEPTTELTIYRIVQEGLTNAYRHSDATHIDVSVAMMPKAAKTHVSHRAASVTGNNVVNISVRDNGRGRHDDCVDGFGLTAMRERVSGLGGSIAIDFAKGGGTLIDAVLPAMTKPSNNS